MATRILTRADYEAAATFSDALQRSGRTHEDVAAEVDVSPGMVHQWAKPLRAISLRRAPAVAAAVGIEDPATISVAFREWVAHARGGMPPGPDAHAAARIDPSLLARCIAAAADAFRAQRALATDAAVAGAAAAMYSYVVEGRGIADAGAAMRAELARFGTSRASVLAPSNRGKRRGQAQRRTAANRHPSTE